MQHMRAMGGTLLVRANNTCVPAAQSDVGDEVVEGGGR
jgi:hypothetical protein